MLVSTPIGRPSRAALLGATIAAAVLCSLVLTLGSPIAALGAGSDATLTVRARGSAGIEVMEVRVAGTVLGTFDIGREWQEYDIEAPSVVAAPDVEVWFVNDGRHPVDRNLQIDWVSFGGRIYQAEAPSTFGTGVWQNGGRCRGGQHRSEWLACNGYLGFGDLPGAGLVRPGLADQPSTELSVTAGGTVGNELLELLVDQVPVAVFRVEAVSDLGDSTGFGRYTFDHPGTVEAERVSVAFVNDRYRPGLDHNVAVGEIEVGGVPVPAERWELRLAAGLDERRCRPSWESRQVLACNAQVVVTSTTGGRQPTTESTTPVISAPPTTAAPLTIVPVQPSAVPPSVVPSTTSTSRPVTISRPPATASL